LSRQCLVDHRFLGGGTKDHPVSHHIHPAILAGFDPAFHQHLYPPGHLLGHHFGLFAKYGNWENTLGPLPSLTPTRK
jgi:hypothetical protein